MSRGLLAVVLAAVACASSVAAINMNCALVVPAQPLTAQGLATPYQLMSVNGQGPCNMTNAQQRAFVEGVIIDLDTGVIVVYNPLVTDAGVAPETMPTVPTLPANYVAGLWFGFGGTQLQLIGTIDSTGEDSLVQANCTQGVLSGAQADLFGKFAYCNAPYFLTATYNLVAAGMVSVPPIGRGSDLLYCPTVRDFSFVDSTPGDGVVTSYLLSLQGGTAQNSAKNRNILLSKHEGYTVISNIDNGADNALLNNYVLPAVACTPWTVTDLVSGQMIGASVLNQIQSDLDYTQDVPKAQVPLTDAQVLTNGKGNLIKLNAYRAGLYQSLLTTVKPLQDGDPASYCMAMTTYTSNLLGTSPTYFQSFPSPNTNIAANLYDYLVLRFQNSFNDLNCATFLNRASPITANLTSTGFVNGTKVTITNAMAYGAYSESGVCVSVGTASGLGTALLLVVLLNIVFILIWCYGGHEALPVQSYHEMKKLERAAKEKEYEENEFVNPS